MAVGIETTVGMSSDIGKRGICRPTLVRAEGDSFITVFCEWVWWMWFVGWTPGPVERGSEGIPPPLENPVGQMSITLGGTLLLSGWCPIVGLMSHSGDIELGEISH